MAYSLPMGGHPWDFPPPPPTSTVSSTPPTPNILSRAASSLGSGINSTRDWLSSAIGGVASSIGTSKPPKSPYASLMPISSAATSSDPSLSSASTVSSASTLGSGSGYSTPVSGSSIPIGSAASVPVPVPVPVTSPAPSLSGSSSGGFPLTSNPTGMGTDLSPEESKMVGEKNFFSMRSTSGSALVGIDITEIPENRTMIFEDTAGPDVREHRLKVTNFGNEVQIEAESRSPGQSWPSSTGAPGSNITAPGVAPASTSPPGTSPAATPAVTPTDDSQRPKSFLDLASVGPSLLGNVIPPTDQPISLDYDNTIAPETRISDWCLARANGDLTKLTENSELLNNTAAWLQRKYTDGTGSVVVPRRAAKELAAALISCTDVPLSEEQRDIIYAGTQSVIANKLCAGRGGVLLVNNEPQPTSSSGRRTASSKAYDGTDFSTWLTNKIGPPRNGPIGYDQQQADTLRMMIDDIDSIGTQMCERHQLTLDETAYFATPVGTFIQEDMLRHQKREVTDDMLSLADAYLTRAKNTFKALPIEAQETLFSQVNGSAATSASAWAATTSAAGTGTDIGTAATTSAATTTTPTTILGPQTTVLSGTVPFSTQVPTTPTTTGTHPAQRVYAREPDGTSQYLGSPRVRFQ